MPRNGDDCKWLWWGMMWWWWWWWRLLGGCWGGGVGWLGCHAVPFRLYRMISIRLLLYFPGVVSYSIRSVRSLPRVLPVYLPDCQPACHPSCLYICLWYYFKIRDEVKRLRMVSLTSASRIYTERTKTLCGILIIGRQLTLFCSHLTEFIRSSIVNLVSSGWMRRMQKIFIISSRIASRLLLRLPIIEEILLFRHITIALSSCPPIRFRFILIACSKHIRAVPAGVKRTLPLGNECLDGDGDAYQALLGVLAISWQ